jgi:hypothetical protein
MRVPYGSTVTALWRENAKTLAVIVLRRWSPVHAEPGKQVQYLSMISRLIAINTLQTGGFGNTVSIVCTYLRINNNRQILIEVNHM